MLRMKYLRISGEFSKKKNVSSLTQTMIAEHSAYAE